MEELTGKVQSELSLEKIEKLTLLSDFLAVIKIGIVNSNALTAFAGVWLALYFNNLDFWSNIDKVIFTLLGTSSIIAGSCAVNNFFDRDIDILMKRTSERPTVTGNFKSNNVLAMAIAFLIFGFLLLSFTTLTAVFFGLVGTITYIFLYTMWSKRRYTLNTVIGSVSGAVPPLIGWGAIDSRLHPVAIGLFLIMFLWQIPHFLALAMKRVDEYRMANIPMLPVVYGVEVTKRQIILWIICLLPIPFILLPLGKWFVLLATILNVGWLFFGIKGYQSQHVVKWATKMFVYSLNYLTILFVSMILFTLF